MISIAWNAADHSYVPYRCKVSNKMSYDLDVFISFSEHDHRLVECSSHSSAYAGFSRFISWFITDPRAGITFFSQKYTKIPP